MADSILEFFRKLDTGNSLTFKGLAAVGALTISYYASTLLSGISLWFTPFRSNFNVYRKKSGKTYAFITGSSNGIGWELAKGLAEKGFGVILTAHVQSELEDGKKRLLKAVPNADVHIMCMNAMHFTHDKLHAELAKFSHLHIRIVANNVAGTINKVSFKSLDEYSAGEIDAQVDCNARFMAHILAIMLPTVRDNAIADGGRGLFLTTGSPGRHGLAYTAVYSGTKAFNTAISRAVQQECILQKWPIDVLEYLPGEVRSSGHTKGVSSWAQPVEDFGKNCLDLTEPAIRRGRSEIIPYWRSAFQFYILDHILTIPMKDSALRDSLQWKWTEERKMLEAVKAKS